MREKRRYRRSPYSGLVRLSWDERGETIYAIGKCIECGEGGVRFISAFPVPLHSPVVLNVDGINLSGCGRVKHVARRGEKFVVGVAFNSRPDKAALASLRRLRAM